MPLVAGKSRKAVSQNIKTEMAAGQPATAGGRHRA